jgi:cell division protein FtsW
MNSKTQKVFDQPLLLAIFALLGIGLLTIASAGVAYGQVRFGDEYFFLKEQSLGFVVGLLFLYIAANIDYHVVRKFVVPIFFIAILFLILVFIPGFGTTVYGAARWIELGPLSFQPSEVMKLAIILYLAAWLSSKRQEHNADFFEGYIPFIAILSLVGFLIIKQPDTGTLGLVFCIALAVFFVSGANLSHILVTVLGGIGTLILLIRLAPYRMERFMVFMNPEHDPLGSGYQLKQAMLALGSGGWLGAGLGQSRQKFSYLPEPVTDSIFAVIGEEVGFIGTSVIVSLFLFIAWRGLRIAKAAPDSFGRLVAVGIVSWIFIQSMINIMAISGLIPLTGIPLPFISYGGTSLAVLMTGIGILLNISKQARL